MAYLEQDVDAPERDWMHHHQVTCAWCGDMVRGIESVVQTAAALPSLAPTHDLWTGIASRLDAPVVPLHGAPSSPQYGVSVRRLAIAATVLVTVSAAVTWNIARRTAAPPAVAARIDSSLDAVLVPVVNADVTYEREIAALRAIVTERFTELDSATVTVLQLNLAIIDKAIADSRQALERDPNSRVLSASLDRALESKLALMRRVALL